MTHAPRALCQNLERMPFGHLQLHEPLLMAEACLVFVNSITAATSAM
jgi:hypothetical protein